MTRKMYFVINARMPNDKAYGIHIAKMCEAFIEAGVDLTLVIPTTSASRNQPSIRDFFRLRVDVPVRMIRVPDWYASGVLPFLTSSLLFSLQTILFLWARRIRGERASVYTVDMDTFSFIFLVCGGSPVYAEMHGAKNANIATRWFFKRAALVIATNTEIKRSLQSAFAIPEERLLVEPNGVDLDHFQPQDRSSARSTLRLPSGPIALYAGRFYEWKGLGILVDAAQKAPDIAWYAVGGTREDFTRATRRSEVPSNLAIVASVPQHTLSSWLAAADALLIIGTAQNDHSYRNTAPMKLYENMAMRVPTVAAATPSLQSMLTDEVLFYAPDNVESLVNTVRDAIVNDQHERVARAARAASEHTWAARATRITSHLS